jgi:hypothetical protein
MADLDWVDMPIHQAIKRDWSSPEILIEGSLNSAKTTVGLDKELDALLHWPGIPILLFRWTEDAVTTKLRPAFETILDVRKVKADWDREQKCYHFENGSTAYCFGLKAVSAIERMNKLRGLGVYRIMGDQVEETDRAVAGELRGRLRPDLAATIRGAQYPFQLTFIANPSDEMFWLSREFPIDNHVKGRRLYSLSVFDNRHLPQASIDSLLRQYAPEHPKHRTMVLGLRGLNITGDAVYENIFDRKLHVREVSPRADAPLLEVFDFGKHNPAWLVGQRTYYGGLSLLGGILGQHLVMEDFLPIVKHYRQEWFGRATFRTATSPMGDKHSSPDRRVTLLDLLRNARIQPVYWRDNANAPDVVLAMIEEVSGLLRRRSPDRSEAFGIASDESRWLVASSEGVKPQPFLSFAFDGGYVWDEHFVSVSNKTIRQPRDDDWYANAMRCVENLVLNFCVSQLTEHQIEIRQRHEAEQRQDGAGGGHAFGPNAWMAF